jgi:PAS domain S-box-containing protein
MPFSANAAMKAKPFPEDSEKNGACPGGTGGGAARGKAARRTGPRGWLNAALTSIGFERWSIGARLALIVIALALPLNLLGVSVVERVVHAANEAQRTSLLYAARSVAAGLDAQLDKYISFARVLAKSPALFEDSLDVFEAEARRAFPNTDESRVVVADLSGQQLMNTARNPGERLPRRSPVALAAQNRAFETGATLVSAVSMSPLTGTWVATIETPIFKDGKPFRELAVTMSMDGFLRLLNEQRMPEGWLAGIIDREGRFIARVPNHDRYVGQLASQAWRAVKDKDGVYDISSIEGDETVTANAHSARSGWTVGIAIKKEELQAAVWSSARSAIAVSACLSLLSLLFAGLIAQRITRPIAELRDNAAALLEGHAPAFDPSTPEIGELWSALQRAASERRRADEALRRLTERFVASEEAAGGFVYDWDASADRAWRSAGLETLLGYKPEDLPPLGDGWFALVEPSDLKRIQSSIDLFESADGRYSFEYRVRHKDGHWVWVWDRGRAVRTAEGFLVRLIGSTIDVSKRKEIEAALAESENRAKASLAEIEAIYDTARVGLCVLDRELRYVRINERLAEINGVTVAGHIGKSVREIVPAVAGIAERIAAGVFETGQGVPDVELSGATFAAPSELRHWLEQWMPLRNAAGEIVGVNVVVEDITERKKYEEQILLLMREVNHRAKNILGVVQAIARHTVTSNPADFVQRFSERLQALARSQDLLIKNEWQGADIAELARAQLAHFEDLVGTRVMLQGPSLRLKPAATQTIGMALNELATNAGKYGALSDKTGRVEINWGVSELKPGRRRFFMSWIESGGPAVSTPSRKGFGSTVIEAMARMGLSADVRLDYESAGLRWGLECQAENALDEIKGLFIRR